MFSLPFLRFLPEEYAYIFTIVLKLVSTLFHVLDEKVTFNFIRFIIQTFEPMTIYNLNTKLKQIDQNLNRSLKFFRPALKYSFNDVDAYLKKKMKIGRSLRTARTT